MSLTQSYDISELDHLTERLARLESLFEAVPLAIAVFNQALTLVRANTRYCELTQLAPAQSWARSIYDAFPNALADLSEQIDVALRRRSSPSFRIPFRHAGGPRVVEATFTALGDESGTGGILFVASDVTELESLRADLARNVTQLEAIFDVIPESIRVFDADGNVVRSNTQAQLDGRGPSPGSLADLWRRDLPRTIDGMSLFVHEHPAARALRGEGARGETLVVRREAPGGDAEQAVVEVNSNPLRDVAGRILGAVTVERDVTERTRLARELAQQVRQSEALYALVSTEAERLERMVVERTEELLTLQESRARERQLAAIGQLAAGVMHDVNNALNPIMAAAHLLTLHADDPEAVRDYAARIARAAETGAATASRVGRFLRQEPLASTEECVDLAMLADEVIAMTRPLWAERARGGPVHLSRVMTEGALAHGIAGEIREALLNLVQNALDAMPGGGTLGVTVRVVGSETVVEVSDTGSGMTPEVRERAFEPFFTTKGVGGSGLGLAEVYGIMRRHRGRAEIESAVGEGTTLRLVFPLAVPAAPPPPLASRRSPKRVLVVEDHDDGREFISTLLATDGHVVDVAASIGEATALLEALSGEYDVLVSDIGLPDGSGWDLVAAARDQYPAMRVGVLTGWEPRSDAAVRADFILRKPVRTEELLALVGADAHPGTAAGAAGASERLQASPSEDAR
jgi:PAS domain S-box-containing protein